MSSVAKCLGSNFCLKSFNHLFLKTHIISHVSPRWWFQAFWNIWVKFSISFPQSPGRGDYTITKNTFQSNQDAAPIFRGPRGFVPHRELLYLWCQAHQVVIFMKMWQHWCVFQKNVDLLIILHWNLCQDTVLKANELNSTGLKATFILNKKCRMAFGAFGTIQIKWITFKDGDSTASIPRVTEQPRALALQLPNRADLYIWKDAKFRAPNQLR